VIRFHLHKNFIS